MKCCATPLTEDYIFPHLSKQNLTQLRALIRSFLVNMCTSTVLPKYTKVNPSVVPDEQSYSVAPVPLLSASHHYDLNSYDSTVKSPAHWTSQYDVPRVDPVHALAIQAPQTQPSHDGGCAVFVFVTGGRTSSSRSPENRISRDLRASAPCSARLRPSKHN